MEVSGLIRIFSKNESKIEIEKPVALLKGSTVKDFALKVHKDFVEKFKFAKITGNSVKFKDQQVGLNHVLEDDDVVELIRYI